MRERERAGGPRRARGGTEYVSVRGNGDAPRNPKTRERTLEDRL